MNDQQPAPQTLLHAAQAFAAAGCSVVPVLADGSKKPPFSWTPNKTARADPRQIDAWFAGGTYQGFAVICGAVSGNLEMFELEGRALAEGYLERLATSLGAHGLGEMWTRITAGYLEASPNGGLHILYRVDGEPSGNTKLTCRPARDDELGDKERQIRTRKPDKIFPRTLVETRGEGGFVVVAPSAGATHETGRPWQLLAGGIEHVATITEDERDALYAISSLLDSMPAPEPPPPAERPSAAAMGGHGEGLRPGDDYNLKADWREILEPHGWTVVSAYGGGLAWRRPGKNRGISATTGTRGGGDNLYVWSSSTEFDTEEPYSKFRALALLEHGGDFAAAARELRRRGYGDPLPHGDENLHELIADYKPQINGPFNADNPRPGVDGNLATVHELRPRAQPRGQDGRPAVDITHEDETIQAIGGLIADGTIPDLYVRLGDVSQVLQVDDGTGPRLVIRAVDADTLRQLLAVHTACYRIKKVKEEFVEVSALPAVSTARAALTPADWPGLRPLAGVTAFPLIRPSGAIGHQAGYDEETRLYHQPAYRAHPAPIRPGEDDVDRARGFLLEHVLADFCFDSPASRANYVALLMTPLLRLYLGGLPPLGIISATTRGSGKSLLAEILDAVYGARVKPWPKRDEECTKVITATLLSDTAPVISFDNVGPFDTVDHPSLAALLTATHWTDRLLGSSANVTAVNDRLWLANGNNVAIGGDIASRSVLVGLDPHTERPEERDGFVIEDLWAWLKNDTNCADLLLALHVLARAWIAAGAPRDEGLRMRNFTTWAQSMAGLTAFHGIGGFLGNKDILSASDDEETETAAFLAAWHRKFRSAGKTAGELLDSSRGDVIGMSFVDPWDGTFPSRPDGNAFTTKGLGHFLKARRGRIFGGLTLVGDYDKKAKVWRYSVRPADEPASVQGVTE